MARRERLSAPFGTWVERDQPIRFRFEGKKYNGLRGDCIASALAANDRWLLSRSFKYHRPRGVLTMAGQDANTLVQLPGDPNVLADRAPLREGLDVRGQNYRGTLKRDRGAIIGRFSRFLPVGFYYRAFFRPRGSWNLWAGLFRRRAGLGVIAQDVIATGYDKQYLFCDVLIVGGGAAGMSAALAAAAGDSEVILVEEHPHLGGALNYARLDAQGEHAQRLRDDLVARVRSSGNIRVLTSATANGWFADNRVPVIQGTRMFKVRAGRVVLATGVLEQHAVFRNNDLPGIMLGSAAQRLMRLYGVRPGRRAVVLTGNDDGYGVALDLLDAGVEVAAVIDLRTDAPVAPMAAALAARNVSIRAGHAVYAAIPARNGRHLAAVDAREIISAGECADTGEVIECDLLCLSVGFMPCYQLACQAGARLTYADDTARFCIVGTPDNMRLAGSVNGHWQVDDVCADGTAAAREHAATPSEDTGIVLNFAWPIFAHPDGKEFVDFDEDLQLADIINAVADGYDDVQLVKRFSTCGMGPSQGRHSALPLARIVARQTGRSVAQTGVTTARPPFAAERIAHCAGRRFFPARRSAMHHRHAQLGAQWLHAGTWYRPAYYGPPADAERVIREEVLRVRTAVGLIDVSTLGGIDIRGADAGEFLDRFYTMGFAKLPVGRSRYALMTNEAGVVVDDGVTCRFSEKHFYVTATTGGVERVFQSMLKWQAQWRLDVDLANVTGALCAVNLAGPYSRTALTRAGVDLDISADGFEYLGVRQGHVAGIPARLLRVGFVGELGYEIHVPHHYGEALWDALMSAGADYGVRPFGVEAQRMLRLEKGHVIIGQDTDAMSNPMELGMGWALGAKKPFYVGQRTLAELQQRSLTRQLVGFAITAPGTPVPRESHLVIEGSAMIGRVTSACVSPTLGQTIGLAYVTPDKSAVGERLHIRCDKGVMVDADVVPLPFFDPKNARQAL